MKFGTQEKRQTRIEYAFADWNAAFQSANTNVQRLVAYIVGIDTKKMVGRTLHIWGLDDLAIFNRAAMNLVISTGGIIYNYPVYIQMSSATYNGTDVPVGMPQRTDESGTVLKWSQYGQISAHADLTDGTKGMPLSNGQVYLPSDKWSLLSAYTLLDETEYQALLPVEGGS